MRLFVTIVLAAMIALGAAGGARTAAEPEPIDIAADAEAPGNGLGLELLALLADGEENQFVSPASLGFALSMAAEGAAGETREVLESALSAGAEQTIPIRQLGEALADSGLKWANAGFVADGLALRDAYADRLEADYGAKLFPLADAGQVNAWVDAHTDHLIDKLMDRLPPDLRLMLVNAIAMDAKWSRPFKATDTWQDVFHAPEGDVEVPTMHQTLTADYAEVDGTQMLRLNYAGSDLYMLIALPGEGGAAGAIHELNARGLEWFDALEPREVRLSLPKFDVSVDNALSIPLAQLGIDLPFSGAADFSGISAEPLALSEVLQKVRVQVDEEGTRAAAVTAVIMEKAMASMQEEPIVDMNVDRPFLAVIAERQTGAICFAGVVADPSRQ